MASDADSLGLVAGAVPLLRDLIHERSGLFYDNSRAGQMADRLAPLVANRGFASFLDYYYLLKYDLDAGSEWQLVMDALSVPETYFWREIDQLRVVVDVIIPSLLRQVTRPLRVWCVPCASGEEPLTLAMMCDQRGWRGEISIEASDASQAALNQASAGLYRERSFRTLPADLRERYFSAEGLRWRVDPALSKRVSWSRVNLLDLPEVSRRAVSDIIFCRNVFIYFSEAAIRRVVHTFAEAMPPHGHLCVGASESLLRITDRFELEQIADAFVYVKKSAAKEVRR